jgi:hypothetical protein
MVNRTILQNNITWKNFHFSCNNGQCLNYRKMHIVHSEILNKTIAQKIVEFKDCIPTYKWQITMFRTHIYNWKLATI